MSDLNTFNPNRLGFGRKRRGLTIAALASALGMTSRTLSDYENGRRYPNDFTISLIARQLHFPRRFFFLDDMTTIDKTAVSFRSLARMSASVRDAAICAGQIALEFTAWVDNRLELPKADLPDLRDYDPEVAAETLRNEWAMGERPISNMVHILEAKGVRVFSLTEETYDMDAYSYWMEQHPFIFLNTKKSVERSRFDAAHELGHILLHKHGSPLGKEAETQANRFASALLMPRSSVIAHTPSYPTLNVVIQLKSFWRVAASALVRRMRDLSLLTEWHYRTLTIELSKRGFMKNEPNAISQRETSKLLPLIFQTLRQEGITKDDIARDLGLFIDDIDAVIFNLTMVGLSGGATKSSAIQNHGKNVGHLRVIK